MDDEGGDYDYDDGQLDEEPDEFGEIVEEEPAEESESEEESEEGEEGEAEGEEEPEPAIKADRQRVDPILRISNRSRTTRLVPPGSRITSNWLTKTEAAMIIALRSQQIEKSATCFVDTRGLHDPCAIAYKELMERRCPLRLRRQVGVTAGGDVLVEEWDVRTMVLPAIQMPGVRLQ